MNYEERRLAFAVIDGVVVFQKNNERKCSKEWLMKDLGLSEMDYETTIRGGLFEDRITLARGSNYDAVPLDHLSVANFVDIFRKYKEIWNAAPTVIYNGQYVREPGVDWPAKETVVL